MIVCHCNVLSEREIVGATTPTGEPPRSLGEVYRCLGCSPKCGRCITTVRALFAQVSDKHPCALCPATEQGCDHAHGAE